MLGETGGRIPCRICLVLIMRMNARSFFFMKNMYIYLLVPDLAIDKCVQYITRCEGKQNVHNPTSFDCLTYLQL
ncbi:hypothetical protein GGI43DRAFT_216896 [Trichoderma evansii]